MESLTDVLEDNEPLMGPLGNALDAAKNLGIENIHTAGARQKYDAMHFADSMVYRAFLSCGVGSTLSLAVRHEKLLAALALAEDSKLSDESCPHISSIKLLVSLVERVNEAVIDALNNPTAASLDGAVRHTERAEEQWETHILTLPPSYRHHTEHLHVSDKKATSAYHHEPRYSYLESKINTMVGVIKGKPTNPMLFTDSAEVQRVRDMATVRKLLAKATQVPLDEPRNAEEARQRDTEQAENLQVALQQAKLVGFPEPDLQTLAKKADTLLEEIRVRGETMCRLF
jgi:hypothetical protein